jgi:hypothetical protein
VARATTRPQFPGEQSKCPLSTASTTADAGRPSWELWKETDNHQFWAPTADAARYTELLKAAYTTIKQTDPTAIVVTGWTSPAADNGDVPERGKGVLRCRRRLP